MKTIKEVVELAAQYLQEKGIASHRREAEELISCALGMSRLQIYMDFHRPLEKEELDKCRSYLKKRAAGEPLAYIVGFVEFYHCKIVVNRHVLIPRQETEILLDLIVQDLKLRKESLKFVVWDVCCGSGCLGVALKKKYSQFDVCLSDISSEALAVAKINAIENDARVSLVEGDLLEPFTGKQADLILCNPPYISQAAYDALDDEVKLYEPKMALLGGEWGLEFYYRLESMLPRFLVPGGKVWMEIGWDQGQAVLDLFQKPHWKTPQVLKDWAGHDRFFSVSLEK